MPCEEDKAWFPARISASNLGWPKRWQGWAVLLGFFAMLVAGAAFMPVGNPACWITYAGGLLAVTSVIVWIKRERR